MTRGSGRAGESALFGLVVSPVIVATACVLGLLAGGTPEAIARGIVAVGAGVGVGAAVWPGLRMSGPARRDALVLVALVAGIVVLIAFLPFTREWWRMRSDAWFHAAVVAQIEYAGLPPEDPYFAGMTLQYMWFYHATVLVLGRAAALDPFWVMACINVHALAALSLSAFYLAGVFRHRFSHRLAATATLLFGFNAIFWVFLPLKLGRVFGGDVRGWEELRRTFTLHPFTYDRACEFANIYYNQEFFLDKFMVATAFGLALVFMTAGWYAAASYLKERRRVSLLLLGGAFVGMLGFHSLVGFIMLVAVCGGSVLALIVRRSSPPRRVRDFAAVVGVSVGALALTVPYLYQLMHLKGREQVFPLDVSWPKTIGIGISCALVIALASRQRHFWSDPAPHVRFFVVGFLAMVAFCLLIALPGPNTYDKLGYFVFVPLAIVAGFALADRVGEAPEPKRLATAAAWALLLFAPLNGLALAACFATPTEELVSPEERLLSDWVREHTPRDAILVDENLRVALLVTAPRRYYVGSRDYAEQWGYPKLEMSRRLHARRALYAAGDLDASALDALGAVTDPLFAVVRPEHVASHSAVVERADLFETVYDGGTLRLVRVDTDACRAAAADRTDRLPPEELIRESGL